LLVQNERRVEGTAAYPLTVLRDGGELGFAVLTDEGVQVGTAEEPLRVADDAVVEDGRVVGVPGWEVVPRAEILAMGNEVTGLRVPLSDEPEDGSIRTQDARNGFVYRSFLVYDEGADTMRNTDTGV